ncbi:hypothetical protein [Streptomyces sp. NPDC020681]|uniref:effector-associated constant component EACC1 n=1 Tax=Streptomyces sp. NPDC020681 TaxID=3365083 RepID=UPI00379F5DFC
MPMEQLKIRVVLQDAAPYTKHLDAWESLSSALADREDLRDSVRRVDYNDGVLRGALPEALAIILGPGVLTAASTVIISWLRHQTSDIKLHVTGRRGQEVTLEGARVREADRAQLQALASELITQLGEDPSDRPTPPT